MTKKEMAIKVMAKTLKEVKRLSREHTLLSTKEHLDNEMLLVEQEWSQYFTTKEFMGMREVIERCLKKEGKKND